MSFSLLCLLFGFKIISHLSQAFAEKTSGDYVHPEAGWVFQTPVSQLRRELQGKTAKQGHSLRFVCNFQIRPAGAATGGTFCTSGPCFVGLSPDFTLRDSVMWMSQCVGASRTFSDISMKSCGLIFVYKSQTCSTPVENTTGESILIFDLT